MRQAFAIWVVRLRYLVIAARIAGAVAATLYLPGLRSGERLLLGAAWFPRTRPPSRQAPAPSKLFSVPLTVDTAVVERDAAGFSVEEQREIVERAVEVTTDEQGGDPFLRAPDPQHEGAVPRGSEEDGTTAVTHLFFSADVSLTNKVELAHAYADRAAGHYAEHYLGPGSARPVRGDRERSSLSSSAPCWRSRSSSG